MVVQTGTLQLKIIWNLFKKIQKTLTNSRVLRSAFYTHTHTHTHTHIGHYSFTVKRSKRFGFLTDLELQWNLSEFIYNPLAAYNNGGV